MDTSWEVITTDMIYNEKDKLLNDLQNHVTIIQQFPHKSKLAPLSGFLSAVTSHSDEVNQIVKETDKKTTRANKRKMDKLFDNMQKTLNQQKKVAVRALEDMTTPEQEEFLRFFASFATFFTELFLWMRGLVQQIVACIKKGLKMTYERLKDIFSDMTNNIKTLFKV